LSGHKQIPHNAGRKARLDDSPSTRDSATTPLRSSAEKYPDVPAPEDPLSLVILAARWMIHDLPCEQMPSIAADLLERGFDSPSLRRLAGENHVIHSAVLEPLVAATFRELGINYPLPPRDAKLSASRQIAREVIHGMRDPWRAADQIENQAANHLENPTCSWDCGIPEVHTILEINDQRCWDPPDRPNRSRLEERILDAFARLAVLFQ
jgi:hypothetical protein